MNPRHPYCENKPRYGQSRRGYVLEAVEFKWGDPIGFEIGYSLSLLQMTAPGDRMTTTEEGR